MTRARNIAGFSTITTTPSPVHVGPIGVLTATRIDGEFNQVDLATRNITAAGIAATNLQVSGITTGLNVSGIITAQNGINFNGTSTGLNVSGVGTIATLSVTGNATVGGVLTYEDVTRVDSVGVITAREQVHVGTGVSIAAGGLNVTAGISTFQEVTSGKLRVDINTTGTVGSGAAEGIFLRNTNETDNNAVTIFGGADDYSSAASAINFINVDHSANAGAISFDTRTTGNSYAERLRITSGGTINIGGDYSNTTGILKVTGKASIEDTGGDVLTLRSTTASSRTTIKLNTNGSDWELGARGSSGSPNNSFYIYDEASTAYRLIIDPSGRVLIGSTATLPAFGASSALQVAGTGFSSGSILIRRDSDNAFSGALVFGKSRGSLGGNTIVQDGDQSGTIIWTAADGTDLTTDLAQIKAKIDGTPGSNDMPGRIEFHTTADGASGVAERMRITSAGKVLIGTTVTTDAPANDAGDIIIGTTSDTQKGITIVGSTSGGINNIFFSDGAGYNNQGRIAYYHANDSMRFTTNVSERMRITSDGYVQIGQSLGTNTVGGQSVTGQDYDPVFKIYSNVASKWLMQLRSDTNSGSNGIFMRAGFNQNNYTMYLTGTDENIKHLIVRGDGRTGIGTDNPDERLEVNGNAKFTPSTGDVGGPTMGVFPHGDITLAGNASATLNFGSRFTGIVIVAGNANDTAAGCWSLASASSYSSDGVYRIFFQNHAAANTTDLTITSPSHGGTHQYQLNQTGSATKTYKIIAFGIHGG